MNDYAPRLRAQQQEAARRAAVAELKRSAAQWIWPVLALVSMVALIGVGIFGAYTAGHEAGHTQAVRQCPPVQQGERLLSSEQRADGAVCRYAEGLASYGRNVKQRRAKP